jgi:flagellar basal body rod protein FlgB
MLDLVSNRQEALAGNIANIDTPGFVRRDIEFSQYINTMNSPLETQLSRKLGPSGVISAREQTLSVADELALMQKNATIYAAAARQMTSTITQFRTVTGVGK